MKLGTLLLVEPSTQASTRLRRQERLDNPGKPYFSITKALSTILTYPTWPPSSSSKTLAWYGDGMGTIRFLGLLCTTLNPKPETLKTLNPKTLNPKPVGFRLLRQRAPDFLREYQKPPGPRALARGLGFRV